MPDEIMTPAEKAPTKAPLSQAAEAPKAKPKPKPKKKAAPKKKVVVSEAKPEAPKPIVKKVVEAKPLSSPLVFSQERSERKPEKKSTTPRTSGAGKFIGVAVLVILVAGISVFAWNKAQQAFSHSEQTATDLRTQVDGEVSGLKDRLQQLAQELQDQKNKQQEVALTEYRNEDIGLSFRYPQSLGQVQPQTDEKKGKKTITLTFSSNPDLWLVASVGDNKSDNDFVYDGGSKNLAASCKEPLKVTADGYCDLIAVLGAQTIEETRPIGSETLVNVVKTVPINWTLGDFKGLTVNVGLGLPPVTGRDLFASPDEKDLQASLEQFFRNLIKREQLSLVVRDNLSAFQTILTSMQTVAKGS